IQATPVTKLPNYFRAKKTQNILILGSLSAGLGSTWRFPYLCHQNGGGSFLLLYVIMLLLLGIPLLHMQLAIGQWLRVENLQVWKKLVPFLGGVGYASILASFLVSLYNSALISWNLFYLGCSFSHPLPWSHCPVPGSSPGLPCLRTVPPQYFWYHTMLGISTRMEEGVEVLVLKLSLCLLVTWTLLCFAMVARIKFSILMLISSMFLSTIFLLCFFIRGLFLEGAVASLRRLVITELSTLASLDMWCQAGSHVLYSLGLGLGTIITFSSYQAKDDNYFTVASFVALLNLVTSILATSTIFLVLGYWATTSGRPCVQKSVSSLMMLISRGLLPQEAKPPKKIVFGPPQFYLDWISNLPLYLQDTVIRLSPPCNILVQEGKFMESPGLAYVAYSQAILLLPGSSFWAIIFFMALVIMGLSTMMILLEGIVLPLQTSITSFKKYPSMLPVITCLVGFMGSLIFTSSSGSYVLFLFDDRLVPMILSIIVAFQNLALVWIYGARRVREEIFNQLDCRLWTPLVFLWSYLTLPILLFLLSVCLMYLYVEAVPYYTSWNSTSQEVKQPYLKTMLGWVTFLSILTLLPVLIYPLQHWWYSEDPVSPDILNKPLVSRKTPMRFSNWSMNPLKRHTNKKVSLTLIKSSRVAPTALEPANIRLPVRDERSSFFSL
uniref:Transporter n=1 Tax=Jaculus jaculus TaxID=51337 RepID=A0A8C5K8S4_JACJA